MRMIDHITKFFRWVGLIEKNRCCRAHGSWECGGCENSESKLIIAFSIFLVVVISIIIMIAKWVFKI